MRDIKDICKDQYATAIERLVLSLQPSSRLYLAVASTSIAGIGFSAGI